MLLLLRISIYHRFPCSSFPPSRAAAFYPLGNQTVFKGFKIGCCTARPDCGVVWRRRERRREGGTEGER